MVFIFFLLSNIYCYIYIELPKYGSIEVYPNTRVYLDLSSFETDEHISFEIAMNYGSSSYYERNQYSFQIEQVSVSTYSDYYDWDNLLGVTSTVIVNDKWWDLTFKWEEIKQEGKTYIFIITPKPFDYFNYKIKIENIQENSSDSSDSNNVVDIIIGVVAAIIGVGILIFCCIKKKNNVNQNIPNPVPEIPLPNPLMYPNCPNNLPYRNHLNSQFHQYNQTPFNYLNMNNNNQTNIVINQTNTETKNNYLINVQRQNNKNQKSSQQNPKQQDKRPLNYPQKDNIKQYNKEQNYPQKDNIRQFNKPDNNQENYPEEMDIQDNDPSKRIKKSIDEDNSVHFNNSISYCNNIDSKSKIINNDNDNAAPTFINNPH